MIECRALLKGCALLLLGLVHGPALLCSAVQCSSPPPHPPLIQSARPSTGDYITVNGARVKKYRGMGSLEAMTKGSEVSTCGVPVCWDGGGVGWLGRPLKPPDGAFHAACLPPDSPVFLPRCFHCSSSTCSTRAYAVAVLWRHPDAQDCAGRERHRWAPACLPGAVYPPGMRGQGSVHSAHVWHPSLLPGRPLAHFQRFLLAGRSLASSAVAGLPLPI